MKFLKIWVHFLGAHTDSTVWKYVCVRHCTHLIDFGGMKGRVNLGAYHWFSWSLTVDGKSSQEYPVNAGVPQGSIFGPTLFLLYIKDLPDDVIWNIAIYADDTTLYSKCDQASDLWQQLELTSELESDLRDTVDWGRKWLVDFIAGKTQLVSFDRSNNTGATDVKMDGSVLEENHLLRCWGWLSLLNWIGALTLSLLPKLPPRKLETWFVLCFFLLGLLCISINLPYCHAWNTGILLSCLGWRT